MSVSAAFRNAQAGLSVALRRADIVSSNVANALTPGYVRRDLAVSEQRVGSSGGGPRVDGVTRATDAALTRERRLAEGSAAREQTIASAQQALNRALGEPDDAFSLSGRYQQLESSLAALATTPESGPNQAQVLEAARAVATGLNEISDRAQQLRQEADQAIARDVGFVNDALKQVEDLNLSISLSSSGGRDASALLDQRQNLINEISKIIPVREITRRDGGSDLITNEGIFLIAGSAQKLEFSPRGVITPDLSYNGGAGVLSGLTVNGADIAPGGPRSNQAIRSGSLAGQFAVRDEVIPAFTAQIDSLAGDLLQRFEAGDTTRAAGAPGLFTDSGAAYVAANETGLAGRVALNPLADPSVGGALFRLRDGLGAVAQGPAGNATIVNSLLDSLREARALSPGSQLSGLNSAAEAAAGIASDVGARRLSAESRLSTAQARSTSIVETELATIGVDTDAELQRLITIQQAYAANARVLQVTQELVETLSRIGA